MQEFFVLHLHLFYKIILKLKVFFFLMSLEKTKTTYTHTCTPHRSYLEEAPTGEIYKNLSIKTKDSNGLRPIE